MKKLLTNLAVVGLTVSLANCASNTQSENTGIGAVTGAVVGGVAGGVVTGGKALGVGVGAVAGALIGGMIGNSMESSDQSRVYYSVNTGRRVTWVNENNHYHYTVIPASSYVTINGNPHCRHFTTTAVMPNGRTETVRGTACRGTNGSWAAIR